MRVSREEESWSEVVYEEGDLLLCRKVNVANHIHEFCKIEVRHTLKRKKSLLVFSFQTVCSFVISS